MKLAMTALALATAAAASTWAATRWDNFTFKDDAQKQVVSCSTSGNSLALYVDRLAPGAVTLQVNFQNTTYRKGPMTAAFAFADGSTLNLPGQGDVDSNDTNLGV